MLRLGLGYQQQQRKIDLVSYLIRGSWNARLSTKKQGSLALHTTESTMAKWLFKIDSDGYKNTSKILFKRDFDILRLDIFWYYNQFLCFCLVYEKWNVSEFAHL